MKKGKYNTAAIWALLLLAFLLLAGCGPREHGEMTGIIFDRGHGSEWGNQFHIEVCAREIVVARYFPNGSADQNTCEHVPITVQQWEAICQAIRSMDLREKRTSWFQKIWASSKQDGGEYRTLTVIWDQDVEIVYQWPESQQAKDLETLLEQLPVTRE